VHDLKLELEVAERGLLQSQQDVVQEVVAVVQLRLRIARRVLVRLAALPSEG